MTYRLSETDQTKRPNTNFGNSNGVRAEITQMPKLRLGKGHPSLETNYPHLLSSTFRTDLITLRPLSCDFRVLVLCRKFPYRRLVNVVDVVDVVAKKVTQHLRCDL